MEHQSDKSQSLENKANYAGKVKTISKLSKKGMPLIDDSWIMLPKSFYESIPTFAAHTDGINLDSNKVESTVEDVKDCKFDEVDENVLDAEVQGTSDGRVTSVTRKIPSPCNKTFPPVTCTLPPFPTFGGSSSNHSTYSPLYGRGPYMNGTGAYPYTTQRSLRSQCVFPGIKKFRFELLEHLSQKQGTTLLSYQIKEEESDPLNILDGSAGGKALPKLVTDRGDVASGEDGVREHVKEHVKERLSKARKRRAERRSRGDLRYKQHHSSVPKRPTIKPDVVTVQKPLRILPGSIKFRPVKIPPPKPLEGSEVASIIVRRLSAYLWSLFAVFITLPIYLTLEVVRYLYRGVDMFMCLPNYLYNKVLRNAELVDENMLLVYYRSIYIFVFSFVVFYLVVLVIWVVVLIVGAIETPLYGVTDIQSFP